MSERAVWRMLVVPGLVAIGVAWTLRSLGAIAVIPSWAGFLITQLVVSAHSHRRVKRARGHLAMIRSRSPAAAHISAEAGDHRGC